MLKLKLSRGYSIRSNEVFGNCQKTKTNFRTYFDLDFQFIENPNSQNMRTSNWVENEQKKFFQKETSNSQREVDYIFFSVNKYEVNQLKDSNNIELSNYYYERVSKGQLSEFFSNCGTNIISNLVKQSALWGIIKYKRVNQANDTAFRIMIKNLLLSFFELKELDEEIKKQIKKEIVNRQLLANYKYFGHPSLATDNTENIKPNSFFKLKSVIRNAIKKLSSKEGGHISKFEATPWFSTQSFLEAFDNFKDSLQKEDHDKLMSTPRYRNNFFLNIEAISEFSSIDNKFNKEISDMKLCFKELNTNFPLNNRKDEMLFTYHPLPLSRKHAITLKKIHQLISMRSLKYFIQKANEFKYGSQNTTPSLSNCFDKLESSLYNYKNYQEIFECKFIDSYIYRGLKKELNYCPPTIFKPTSN